MGKAILDTCPAMAHNSILLCSATGWIYIVPQDEYCSSTLIVTWHPLIATCMCEAFEPRTCMLAPLSRSSWKGPSPAGAGCASWWSSGTEPLWCQQGPDTFACRCSPCWIQAPFPRSPSRPHSEAGEISAFAKESRVHTYPVKGINKHNGSPERAQGTLCGFWPTPSSDSLEERLSITQAFYGTWQIKVAMYDLDKFLWA